MGFGAKNGDDDSERMPRVVRVEGGVGGEKGGFLGWMPRMKNVIWRFGDVWFVVFTCFWGMLIVFLECCCCLIGVVLGFV